jgi:hypothetical protein
MKKLSAPKHFALIFWIKNLPTKSPRLWRVRLADCLLSYDGVGHVTGRHDGQGWGFVIRNDT